SAVHARQPSSAENPWQTDAMQETSDRQPPRLAAGITREVLETDGLRRVLRQRHPEVELITDRVMRQSIAATLDQAPPQARAVEGVWVFGYGSLLWNPCVPVAEWRGGRIYGHHRDFHIRLTHGRGSPEAPGLMLGLVPGGSCPGMGLRIAARDLKHELLMIWRREMLTGVYRPRWVWLHTDDGCVPAITFVVNTCSRSYCGRLAPDEMVHL